MEFMSSSVSVRPILSQDYFGTTLGTISSTTYSTSNSTLNLHHNCFFYWRFRYYFKVRVQSAFWVLHRDLYQFLRIFRTQMAGHLDRLLDPYQITPSFVCFPSLDAPAPASLASAHSQQRAYVLVWCNSPSVASTDPIFKRQEIETFVISMSWHDGRWHCSIKTGRNDKKCDRK